MVTEKAHAHMVTGIRDQLLWSPSITVGCCMDSNPAENPDKPRLQTVPRHDPGVGGSRTLVGTWRAALRPHQVHPRDLVRCTVWNWLGPLGWYYGQPILLLDTQMP